MDVNKKWTENSGKNLLNTMKVFIDNLQNVLFDSFVDDCMDIVHRYKRNNTNTDSVIHRNNNDNNCINDNNNNDDSYNSNCYNVNNYDADNNDTNSNTPAYINSNDLLDFYDYSSSNSISSTTITTFNNTTNNTSSNNSIIGSSNYTSNPSSSSSSRGSTSNLNVTTNKANESTIDNSRDIYSVIDTLRNNKLEKEQEKEKKKRSIKENNDSIYSLIDVLHKKEEIREEEKLKEKERIKLKLQCKEDDLRITIKSAIRRQIEVEVYVPNATKLRIILSKSYAIKEKELKANMSKIFHQSQSFFGIPTTQISPSSWDVVINLLRDIKLKTLPCDRLECLLLAAKEIPLQYSKEHSYDSSNTFQNSNSSINDGNIDNNNNSNNSSSSNNHIKSSNNNSSNNRSNLMILGGDDFLPIFIYVIVKAQINDVYALNEELQAICDPDKKISETGRRSE